jgi:hypothetical protein
MALHSVVFVGGSFSGPANSAELPGIVNPGQSVDVSVPLTSPGTPGIYRSDWKFKVDTSPSGPLLVGVGASSVAMYAQIVVPAGAPTAVPGARITFAPGATQAFVNGSLAAGQAQDYLININGGQTMILTLSTPSAFGAKVSVLGTTGPNPNVINANPEGSYWLGTLPVTQDYIIRVQAGAAPSTFSLNVVVPQRISFAPGAISASTPGTTSARRTVTYLLKANAQQTMTVTLLAPPSSSAITIYGLTDGQPLVRYVSGAMTWTGQLPATQDYVIEVVPATDATVNYILNTFVQ